MSEIALQAGPLQLVLLPEEGAVRWIYASEHEVLRGINAPVRDRGWGTVRPLVDQLEVDRRAEGFRATFFVRCREGEVDFRWRGELTGTADGRLDFLFDGEALADFPANRIGFCVLYPAAAAGLACAVERVDGTVERTRFPTAIEPHQPVRNIRGLRHLIARGLEAEVRMEGDVFEMEDQRNWTDASFKIYCTPLDRPAPSLVTRGTRVRQWVSVRMHGRMTPPRPTFVPRWKVPREIKLALVPVSARRLPSIGTVWNVAEADERIVAGLQALGLDHLRVDLALANPRHHAVLRGAVTAAERLGVALELAVFVDDEVEARIAVLRRALEGIVPRPQIARWLVFDVAQACTPPRLVGALRSGLRGTRCEAPVGGGTIDNFTELNRDRAIATVADFTVHACNPQVHACDDASLFETLPMQGLTTAAARELSGGRPVVLSPVTLTRRWRATDSGAPAAGAMPVPYPFRHDVRMRMPLAAAWTLGSLAALAEREVTSVTLHEAVGGNGLVAVDGRHQPAAEALAALQGRTGAAPWRAISDDPTSLAGLTYLRGANPMLALGNLRAAPIRAVVEGGSRSQVVDLAPYQVLAMPVET